MSDTATPVTVDRLMALELFGELDHHDLAQVVKWVSEVRAEAGEALFEQGGLPYELFVIEQGEVEVVRDGEPMARLGPGTLVGEMSVLKGERRMATVRAVTPVVAISMSTADLDKLATEMPEVVRDMRRITQERIERNAAED
jgi:CRP-like cAMP-binding protein